MRRTAIVLTPILLFWLASGGVPVGAGEIQEPKTVKRVEADQARTPFPIAETQTRNGGRVSRAAGKREKAPESVRMPVYKPPLRGAPGHRVGGGTRGSQQALPMIVALAPDDHIGRTYRATPMLYWHLSQQTDRRLVLTVNEKDQVEPVLEVTLPAPSHEGFQRIDLSQVGLVLEKGTAYQWLVSLVVDPARPSSDLIIGGWITRLDLPPQIARRVRIADPLAAMNILAEAGFWYDAVDVISHGIETEPSPQDLEVARAELLSQIGLSGLGR